MGRTLPSITQTFQEEEAALQRFRRALRRGDQQALDELLAAARKHLSAAAYAAHPWPFELFLLAMLLEEHKHLQALLQSAAYPGTEPPPADDPPPVSGQPTDEEES